MLFRQQQKNIITFKKTNINLNVAQHHPGKKNYHGK